MISSSSRPCPFCSGTPIPESASVRHLVGHNPLFRGLSPRAIDVLLRHAQPFRFARSHVLFVQQDPANFIYFILSGWVKLFRETVDGGEAVLDVLSTPHFFGEAGLFNDRCYPFGAQMAEEGSLLGISVSAFDELLTHDPLFARNLLAFMARERTQQDQELEHRTLQNAPQRIGCFLLRLCPPDGQTPDVHLPYDKTMVAARLGMQPETFSRALARLREDVGLVLHGSVVTIPDLPRLHKYVCSGCSGTWPCQG